RIAPSLGGSTPAIRLNNVDLPAPFGPSTPRISPGLTVRFSSSMTLSPPKRRETPCNSRSGSPAWDRPAEGSDRRRLTIGDRRHVAVDSDIRRRGVVDVDEIEREF